MSDEVKLDLLDNRVVSARYTSDYKDAVFYTWYSRNKCVAGTLLGYIEEDINGNRPSESLLKGWIRDDFTKRAEELDKIVKTEIETKVVTDKIEMLKRHADTGVEMQNMAIEYLRENKGNLKTNTAVRLLVDGIRVERESRGLPTLVTEVLSSGDDELMTSLEKLLNSVNTEELEDGNELSDL